MLEGGFSLNRGGSTHIAKMNDKGLSWLDRLNAKSLLPRDVWLSFHLQLHHGMIWGLLTVIMPSNKMEDRHYKSVFVASQN